MKKEEILNKRNKRNNIYRTHVRRKQEMHDINFNATNTCKLTKTYTYTQADTTTYICVRDYLRKNNNNTSTTTKLLLLEIA